MTENQQNVNFGWGKNSGEITQGNGGGLDGKYI